MSDTTMLAMVVRILEARGKTLAVQKLGSSATDTNKPWHGASSQTVSDELDVFGMFLPAVGHGLGRFIDQKEISNELAEFVIISPPTTGEDLQTYQQIEDGSVVKRIAKWWVLKPADTVVAYVAGILK